MFKIAKVCRNSSNKANWLLKFSKKGNLVLENFHQHNFFYKFPNKVNICENCLRKLIFEEPLQERKFRWKYSNKVASTCLKLLQQNRVSFLEFPPTNSMKFVVKFATKQLKFYLRFPQNRLNCQKFPRNNAARFQGFL